MQSTRWHLAADSPSANGHYHLHDDSDLDKVPTKNKQRKPTRKVTFAPSGRSQGPRPPLHTPDRGSFTDPSRPAYSSHPVTPTTTRPTHHRPGFLEELLRRPHKVRCWGCHSFAWLPRNGSESPNDWTCGICQTHQRRDKHGDLIPVPEMFDSELNEATAERMSHSVFRRRYSRHQEEDEADDQRSVFCRTCRSNHRLTYQIMGDFLPDDDHPDYERLVGNIEQKRKALEQRYPPVCDKCIPKVEQVLANQRTQLKTNLLNGALQRGKVDHIRYIRRYPRLSWVIAALVWMCGNTCLLAIHYYDAGLPDLLPSLGRGGALKQPALLAQDLTELAASIGRPNLVMFALVTGIAVLAILDFVWNPLQFSLERSPHRQLRTRPTLKLAQIISIPLRAAQCWSLYSLCLSSPKSLLPACLFLVQLGFCYAFLSGRYTRDPVTIHLGPTRSSATRIAHGLEKEEVSDDERKHSPSRRTRLDPPKRTVSRRREEENPFIGRDQPSLHHGSLKGPTAFPSSAPHQWGSRSSSPDDNINWSPRKPRQVGDAGRLPPQFGMYRDSDNQAVQSQGLFSGHQQEQEHTGFNPNGLQSLNPSNKFHSRAYEPSPLARPSMVMEAAQQGSSLGEMFGFPSARFQPPVNHFAHRSAPTATQDMWSHRRRDEPNSRTNLLTSLLDDSDTCAMDDDDDDDDDDNDDNAAGSDGDIRGVRHTRPKPKQKRKEVASDVDDLFGSLGFGSSSAASAQHGVAPKGKRNVDMFAQQRFFPPDANTGLEDNFWGAVKIEDDELRDTPRTREGRNMAMKKRMAFRWLLAGIVSRAIAHVAALPWLTLLAIVWFVGVLLHAIGFWIVDQRQSWISRSGQGELEKFKPVLMDKVFSHVLFLCCVGRLCSMLIDGLGYEDQIADLFAWWPLPSLSWPFTATALDGMMVASLLGLILAGSGHSSPTS